MDWDPSQFDQYGNPIQGQNQNAWGVPQMAQPNALGFPTSMPGYTPAGVAPISSAYYTPPQNGQPNGGQNFYTRPMAQQQAPQAPQGPQDPNAPGWAKNLQGDQYKQWEAFRNQMLGQQYGSQYSGQGQFGQEKALGATAMGIDMIGPGAILGGISQGAQALQRSNMENAANNSQSPQWQAYLKWRQGLQAPTNTSVAAQVMQGQGTQAQGGGPTVQSGYGSPTAQSDYERWKRQRQYGT